MTHEEKHELVEIVTGEPFKVRQRLREFIDRIVVDNESDTKSMEAYRTNQQNKAIHVWFDAVSKTCNENGVDAKLVMSKVIRMDMTPVFIKEMWKTLQTALFGKTSTTQLRKSGEIDRIVDHFIRFFANEFELELPPFPSLETKEATIRGTDVPYPDTYEKPLI